MGSPAAGVTAMVSRDQHGRQTDRRHARRPRSCASVEHHKPHDNILCIYMGADHNARLLCTTLI